MLRMSPSSREEIQLWTWDRLQAVAEAVGATTASGMDPVAQLQSHMLRQQLQVVCSVLMDEDLDMATYVRIIDKIIYGCLPQSHETQWRRDQLARTVAEAMNRPIRLFNTERTGGI